MSKAICGRRVVGVLLLLVVLVLVGCGTDPFLGTWQFQQRSASRQIVIVKTSAGYRAGVTWQANITGSHFGGYIDFRRDGDVLTPVLPVVITPDGRRSPTAALTYEPDSGHLVMEAPSGPVEFERVGDSTTLPTPQPTRSP